METDTNNQNDIIDDEKDSLITETGVSFRDRVSNIDIKGKRIWIFPKKPNGDFHKARIIVSIVLIAFLAISPFLKIGDRPFLMFNIIQRKFIIFGNIFWPQDFFIFALAFLSLVIFIVLFTALYGRIWCGWACPQTIFLEMVFRKIEYWIEGDSQKQMALANAPWTSEKILKKVSKQLIFFVLSFFIANIFLAYIIGSDELGKMVTDGPFAHTSTFSALVIFSSMFYFVFAWFREQACTYVCPYGRLQSVLLDKNSIVVAYDFIRGEPRAKFKKEQSVLTGDCVDCGACVKVCPTGIDIRNGTQLECVNCTACIDSCDAIMEKVGRPKKLIRYTSQNMIVDGLKFKFTPRLILYSTLLFVLLSAMFFMLLTRSDIEATILKTKGTLYQKTDDNYIANIYTATIINKTFKPKSVELKVLNLPHRMKLIGNDKIVIGAEGVNTVTFLLEIPNQYVTDSRNEVIFGIYSNGKLLNKVKTLFSGPIGEIK